MKIINEKGKLFGVINVVDLLVILIIVAVAAGVIWKLAGTKVSEALADNMEITYTVLVENQPESYYDEIKDLLPSQLMASGEWVNGEIVSVEKQESLLTGSDAEGKIVNSVNEGYCDMLFTVTSIVPSNSIDMKVGTQEMRIGKDTIVKCRYFEFTGRVLTLDVPK